MQAFVEKIDKIDRKILSELDINCRIPITKLAKKVRKSRPAVEYRINQLIKKGIIKKFNTSINLHKIGFKIYKMYFKLKGKPETIHFIHFLRSTPEVWWLGETEGSWDIIFGAFFRTDKEFYNFKNKLVSEYQNIIIEYYGTTHIDVRQYPKMYLSNNDSKPVLFGDEIIDNKLDNLDFQILTHIANNARISINKLATEVKSTPIVVRNRLRKLEAKGIIIQYRISIDISKLGLEHYKAIIFLDNYTSADEKRLFTYAGRIPNIVYFIRDMWRIELEFIVSNFAEYNTIINNLKTDFSNNIRNIETVHLKTDDWTENFERLQL